MSGAALLQLVALGSQDAYLTSNASVTFFKSSYRRYTMFSQEVIAQSLNGTVRFGASRLSAQIFRHADLLSDLFCTVRLPNIKPTLDTSGTLVGQKMYCDFAALALITEAECEVGGSRIDKLHSTYMFAMHDLAVSASHRRGIEVMLGNFLTPGAESELECIVPLPFWFTLNAGSSLNLVGMQYHEVRITLSLAKLDQLTRYVYAATPLVCDYEKRKTNGDDSAANGNAALGPLTESDLDGDLDLRLYGKYTYLDADERKRFATNSSESLLVVSQITTETIPKDAQTTNVRLNFNHPCSELIILPSSDWCKERNMHFNFHSSSEEKTWTGVSADAHLYYSPCKSLLLKLNNHELQAAAPGSRFNLYTNWRAHTCIPEDSGIMTIPFALHAENSVQPSGTLNMSRVDSSVVEIGWDPAFTKVAGSVTVYGRNWNVFRQTGGMGGVAYSN